MDGRVGRSNVSVSAERHDPATRAQFTRRTRPPSLAEGNAPDGLTERQGSGLAHTGQCAVSSVRGRDGAANRQLVDGGEFPETGTDLSRSRNRGNLPARDSLVAAVRVRGGVQQHVGVAPVGTPVGAGHEVTPTSEPLRATGLQHDDRQARPAQRSHRLGTDNRGVRVADDHARLGPKRRPTAARDQPGADHQWGDDEGPWHVPVIATQMPRGGGAGGGNRTRVTRLEG